MKCYRFILLLLSIVLFTTAQAQLTKAFTLDSLQINTADQFAGASKNWSVKSAVVMNRTSDDIKFSPGKGILVFEKNKENVQNSITAFEHGNMDFEIEFMLSPGAEASVLFQGLYQIHLRDSWGEKNSSNKTCGGISVQNAMLSGNEKIRRIPASNACHAPGLWQKLEVSFAAPVFTAQGVKIKNARFDKVVLNGAVIHENIELPVAGSGEKATGPFVIMGIKGPAAFRNIAHTTMKDEAVTLKNISYRYTDGKMNTFPDFDTAKILKKGSLEAISWQPTATNEDFAFEYKGMMDVPATNQYNFEMLTLGGGRLVIDGKKIMEHASGIDHEGRLDRKDVATATINLNKGLHPFTFIYYRNTWATVPVLGLSVQGRGNYRHALNDDNSYPLEEAVSSIIIKPTEETVMQRSFLMYNGKRKTYCISVGHPSGVHYSYDLSNGSLLQVWKGAFADATGMWHTRGNQILQPLGAPLLFNDQPQFAATAQDAAWPDTLSKSNGYYQLKGYDLDANRNPVFKYNIAGLNVADALYPEEDGKILTRKLNVKSNEAEGDVYFRMLKAKKIDRLANSEFYINDGEYFIHFNSSLQPTIRETGDGSELVVLIKKGSGTEINYSIIW